MGFFQRLFPPSSSVGPLPANPSVLDIVVYTAGLASNPRQIEPVLDKIRVITAQTGDGKFSSEQQSSMTKVYIKLEDYLVNQEPLRKFTREGLRARLPHQFTQALSGGVDHE